MEVDCGDLDNDGLLDFYQSHWGSRLHFGLGPRDRVDRIEIRWTGSGVKVLESVAIDRPSRLSNERA